MNWEVQECEFDHIAGVVGIKIAETAPLWDMERSPREGSKAKLYDHTEELVWRHLNVFLPSCEIRCRLPRGQCSKSGKGYRITPPWEGLSKHFTEAFETFALLLMREIPVLAVSRTLGRSDRGKKPESQPLARAYLSSSIFCHNIHVEAEYPDRLILSGCFPVCIPPKSRPSPE
jgi:hypothetical protein